MSRAVSVDLVPPGSGRAGGKRPPPADVPIRLWEGATMNELFILLETTRSFGLAALSAILALSAWMLVFDRATRKDARIDDAARPEHRRAA